MSKRPIVFFSGLKSVDRFKPGSRRTDYCAGYSRWYARGGTRKNFDGSVPLGLWNP